MDELLARAGSQAVTFAIRSGISIASSYAVKNVAKFLTKVPQEDRTRLTRLKKKLQTRIDIVSSAIDLIKLVAARGNTNLESTLTLTRDLKLEIDAFDERVSAITEGYVSGKNKEEVSEVETYMVDLLDRIEEAIPLINLALTTSGANLNGALPNQVSPGRLLQAADIVNRSNDKFDGKKSVRVGPVFELTLYSIFYHRGRVVNNVLSEISWKEEFTRAHVSIWRRVHEKKEFDYALKIEESFDDGRYHDEEEEKPGLKELNVSTVTKLFFSASGKLLKLEDRSTPVLVLKVNKSFDDDVESSDEEDKEPAVPQVEWVAFGEYEHLYDSSSSSSDSDSEPEEAEPSPRAQHRSLSLLEYVLRLCVLQSNDQLSILNMDDERLALYLQDENNATSNSTQFSEMSTPSKTTERRSNTLTARLQKMSMTDSPQTPQKMQENETPGSRESPVPGEPEGNLTPWERDKLAKVDQMPSLKSLRKSVLSKRLG